jgi:hypothetical protein
LLFFLSASIHFLFFYHGMILSYLAI